MMATSLDKLYEQAMKLSDESKALLAERLVEYIQTHVNPALERLHLDTVKRRRDEMRGQQVEPIHGEDALARARGIINK